VLFAFTLIASPAHARYGGGTGEPNDPYLIYTAEQMDAIGAEPNDWGKHFKLMADIDLSGLPGPFHMIGKDPNTPFTGVFDGGGHSVSGFVWTSGSANDVGLFGVMSDLDAAILNLTVVAPRIDCWGQNVGTLVGLLRAGTLFNCHAQDVDIDGHNGDVGGLVGRDNSLQPASPRPVITIRNCSCTGRVRASFNGEAGGLVGRDWVGCFYDCFAACEVSSSYMAAGLAGDIASTRFVNCYATGTVTGGTFAGGLIGHGFGNVVSCYSASRTSGTRHVGGLMGMNTGPAVTRSLWDAGINSDLNDVDATGRTTAQMQDPNTFMALGWDFLDAADGPSDIWARPAGGGYPILWWQVSEPPSSPFAGGKGDVNDPYLIRTARQLNSIGHNPRLMASHFRLTDDIDLTGAQFCPIGSEEYPYAGRFDGGNYTISNFTYATTEADDVGLFRVILGGAAEVRSLGLANPVIDAPHAPNVGALAGLLKQGVLCQCRVTGGRISGQYSVGGLVGHNGARGNETSYGRTQLLGCRASTSVVGYSAVGGIAGGNGRDGCIADCHAEGDIAGQSQVGGLAGTNSSGTIVDCSSGGQVTGSRWVGGLVGMNLEATIERSFSRAHVQGTQETGGLAGVNSGAIVNCYFTGEVSGEQMVGGLVGSSQLTNPAGVFPGTISKCYSAGHVAGKQNVGGLVGYQTLGSITASFWDVQTSGVASRSSEFAKTTAQMQTASTFLAAGWDFAGETENGTEDIWWILEGQDYPRLSWELGEE
jgi:hypothetical protein